jgi:hypothetical protein
VSSAAGVVCAPTSPKHLKVSWVHFGWKIQSSKYRSTSVLIISIEPAHFWYFWKCPFVARFSGGNGFRKKGSQSSALGAACVESTLVKPMSSARLNTLSTVISLLVCLLSQLSPWNLRLLSQLSPWNRLFRANIVTELNAFCVKLTRDMYFQIWSLVPLWYPAWPNQSWMFPHR